MRYYQTGFIAFGASTTSGADYRAQWIFPVPLMTSPSASGTNAANSGFSSTVGTLSGNATYVIEARNSNASVGTGYFQTNLIANSDL